MIYFMRAGETGHVKIGWTRDEHTLDSRKSSLQTGQPLPLLVIRTIDNAPRWGEIWLQGFFAGMRAAGEWFHGFFAGVRAVGEWFDYQEEMMTMESPANAPPGGEGANDIHVRLSDDEFDQLLLTARREDRSLTNMARALIREALAARQSFIQVTRGHSAKSSVLGTITPQVEPCVTTDALPAGFFAPAESRAFEDAEPPKATPKEVDVTTRFKVAKR